MSDYQPISCDLHSEYEVAIMHGRKLLLTHTTDSENQKTERITPTDLRTENHEEFLLGTDHHGLPIKIRLDRIINFDVI
ncbi:MAG: transcriptional antiterminator, Rof [Gammaproteobacteria bacterium]